VSNTDIIDFVDVEILYDERNYNENDLVTQKFTVSFLVSLLLVKIIFCCWHK